MIDPRIDLRSLEAFYWVVKLGNFHRAADKLITSQSAISHRIDEMEERLGQRQLLDRRRRPFVLTEVGETIFGYAQRLLQLHEEMLSKVTVPAQLSGTLHLGVVETIVHTWLPGFLQRMRSTYPNVSLVIDVDISATLKTRLLAQKVDLALMVGPVDDNDLCSRPLMREQLAFLASPRLGLASSTPLSPIARHPIITFPRNTRPFREVETLFSGVAERPCIHASASVATIITMALEGLGVAVLPRSIVHRERASGALVEIHCEAGVPDLEFVAAWHTSPRVGHIDALVRMAAEAAAGRP